MNIGGHIETIAQKDKNTNQNDDPDGDLGMHIKMDGETYNIAQKHRKANINENNFISFPYGSA